MNWIKKIFGIKKVESAFIENEVLTVVYEDGSFDKYVGSCTVWHSYPLMNRCSTNTEKMLFDIWTYIKKFGNNYPDAHENNIII